MVHIKDGNELESKEECIIDQKYKLVFRTQRFQKEKWYIVNKLED